MRVGQRHGPVEGKRAQPGLLGGFDPQLALASAGGVRLGCQQAGVDVGGCALGRAGAREQVAALASRAAAHAPLDAPGAVAELLAELQEARYDQAAALAGRLPSAGLFKVFLGQQGRADQFRFGREADGSPSAPWGWEDLDLWLAPPSVVEQREPSATPTRVSVRRPIIGHAGAPPGGQHDLRKRCLVRPVRSIVR